MRTRRAWHEIAIILNSMGGERGDGCIKSRQRWCKFWKDKKAATKRKANQFAAKRQTDNTSADDCELSIYEQRILRIMGETKGDDVNAKEERSDRDTEVKPFHDADVPPDSEAASSPSSINVDESQMDGDGSDGEWGESTVRETVYVKSPQCSPERMSAVENCTVTLGDDSSAPPIFPTSTTVVENQGISASQRRLRALRRRQHYQTTGSAPRRHQSPQHTETDFTEQLIAIEERRSKAELHSARALQTIAGSIAQVAQSWTNLTQALIPMAQAFTDYLANNNVNS